MPVLTWLRHKQAEQMISDPLFSFNIFRASEPPLGQHGRLFGCFPACIFKFIQLMPLIDLEENTQQSITCASGDAGRLLLHVCPHVCLQDGCCTTTSTYRSHCNQHSLQRTVLGCPVRCQDPAPPGGRVHTNDVPLLPISNKHPKLASLVTEANGGICS
jgi:hypothetical protein